MLHQFPAFAAGLILVGCLTTDHCFGQGRTPEFVARQSKLHAYGAKLDLSLRLDRPAYIPFERIAMTIRIHNPTPIPLETAEPFTHKSAALDLFSQHPRWRGIIPDEIGPSSPNPRSDQLDIRYTTIPPTRMLAAGEEITRTFYSDDRLTGDDQKIVAAGSPLDIGQHRIVYTLTSKSVGADFIVVPAVLDAISYVRLAGTFQARGWPDPRFPGQEPLPTTHPRGTIIAALDGDGAHWIVISGLTAVSPGALYGKSPGAALTVGDGILSNFTRLARSAQPITSISGTAAPDDTISITWTDSNGKTGSLRVDTDRRVFDKVEVRPFP
ncbi:MAG: hypothetical protein U0R19_26440 [Bryobacteraceae bacterium]